MLSGVLKPSKGVEEHGHKEAEALDSQELVEMPSR